MRFWKRYSVCKQCSVHFEPAEGSDKRWGYLCPTHRKPVREEDQKKDAVMAWAAEHWKRLAEQKDKESADLMEQWRQLNVAMQQASLDQQMAAQQHQNYANAAGMFGGGINAGKFGNCGQPE